MRTADPEQADSRLPQAIQSIEVFSARSAVALERIALGLERVAAMLEIWVRTRAEENRCDKIHSDNLRCVDLKGHTGHHITKNGSVF